MRVLSLFSGIGLLDLGLAWAGFTTVGLCEIEPYCREVLAKHWPGVPIWSDVREVTGDAVRERCGAVDLVAGGFPCQPHSVAGARKGREDERHLWPEFARVVRELRPRWVLAENVPGLRTTAADEVLSDLDAAGYACWPLVVGADDVGAPHRRKRVWIVARQRLAHSEGERREAEGDWRLSGQRSGRDGASGPALAHGDGWGQHRQRIEGGDAASIEGREGAPGDEPDGCGAWPVGSPTGPGLEGQRANAGQPQVTEHRHPGDPTLLRGWPARPGEQQHEWEAPRLADGTSGEVRSTRQPREVTDQGQPQPGMGGESDGCSRRLAGRNRRAALRALGNGVVPQVVAEVGRAIMAAERGEAIG